MTDTDLLQLLRDCYTPGTHRNIVDAALVKSATLLPDHNAPGASVPNLPMRYIARIALYAPTPNPDPEETANAQLLAQIENRLLGHPSISRVELTLLPALFLIL